MDYKVKLKHVTQSCVLTKAPNDSHGFLAAEISKNFYENRTAQLLNQNLKQDLVFIAKDDAQMDLLQKQMNFFAPKQEVLNFYAWDCLPFDRASPRSSILANRIKLLHRLANRSSQENFFIITSVNSVMQKTIAPSEMKNLALDLAVGTKSSVVEVSNFLASKGYVREACANNVGEFAVRGGIVDLVMQEAADLVGYRIDFFGNEIDSIKVFDPLSQLSEGEVKALRIVPTAEVILGEKTLNNFRKNYRQNFEVLPEDQLYNSICEMRSYPGMEHWLPFFYEEKLVSFFSYLNNPVTFFDDQIFSLAQKREEQINEYYQARIEDLKIHSNSQNIYNPLDPALLYFSAQNLQKEVQKTLTIEFRQFDFSDPAQRIIDLEFSSTPDFALAGRANKKDPINLLNEFVRSTPQKKVALACLSEGFKDRVVQLLSDYGIATQEIQDFDELKNVKLGKAALFVLPTYFGFCTSDLIFVGEQALFGEKTVRKKISKAASQRLVEEGLSINLGELIVHRDHGIGKFDGIHTINAVGIKTDMIKIIYGNNDVLFVPVDDINLISRYGADNPLIQLDRLGAGAWKNRREKARKKIKIAAEALLQIAAARHLKKAPIFVPNQQFYDEFKARFAFVETQDQLRSIEEVEEDLRKGLPMDRLICGDVGFGKTEVAMRAAALVCTQAQVAIIAPTTLLARQHFKNFSKRFEGLEFINDNDSQPTKIKIAQLSRLVSGAEAKKAHSEIELGTAQIVIGTHSLLHKNMKFFNLGLVIIDEEQHFGVGQKERLKEMKNEAHVLSLSATPIPRTLQMSLTGVKDLSIISTPPIDRLAVRNFVMPYDAVVTREAIMREYNRSGRVFFVVPRVRDIEELEPRLKILLPEIKISHAHGQMTPNELDQIMNDFIDGKSDVLLSTTIIESGIDIVDANTMIIYRADMFGLSQLYQLRGRVGRGKVRGYCYFMYDNRKKVSQDSHKKLEVMQNLDSLGVGFSVANHDMDIRGSGNLLGEEQSGHVKETGVELYQQMLLETIEKLKNSESHNEKSFDEKEESEFSTTVKLRISMLIPEDYMSDLSLRMSFYKKISNIKNEEDRENLINEMTDRFGKIPQEVMNLFAVSILKNSCKKIGVENLESCKDGILIGFHNNKFSAADKLAEMIFSSKNQVKLSSGQKLLFIGKAETTDEKLGTASAALKTLQQLL